MVKIVGICGSLRKDSLNRKLLAAAVKLCPAGAKITPLDWSEVPIYNQDLEADFPAAVTRAKTTIKAADAVLIVTPEYNASIPGPLKNLFDWCSRPYGDSAWAGKPVALLGASPGMLGTSRAQYELRKIFTYLDMQPVQQPEIFVGGADKKFDAKGAFTDKVGSEMIAKQLTRLISLAKTLKAV